MTSNEIRQQFLDFFASKGHTIVPSSPVVPHDDPTLMFTNAGMNQFKPIFLGQREPDVDKWPGVRPGRRDRAADTQKCIRAGGKHNDLDDVGQDTYHHTFFEMLGNWSFGDYFKKEAIQWAWELLTEVWGIPKDRLHATYFEGKKATSDGGAWELEPDNEARDLWASVTDIDPSHIHPGDMKDNFWEMGDTGPCGPCSEVHIDLTADKSGAKLVNAGDARVIELWNLVFIQFNRAADGTLSSLPAKHVDTGMGFERLCATLQGMAQGRLGAVSNYDTDVFTTVFEAIRKRTGAAGYAGTLPERDEGTEAGRHEGNAQPVIDNRQQMIDVSYRVIADHVRCLTFALTDGAMPSNEGRGYVLRRILRRAVRYGRQYMGMHEPFLCDLVPAVVDQMKHVFPELESAHGGRNVEHVTEIIRDEEESFGRTFDRGLKLYQEEAEYARRHHHGRISGEAAFKLHDTYGFTIDLTERMAQEDGLTVDIGEYERLMEEAREKARGGSTDDTTRTELELRDLQLLGVCDDSYKYDPSLECSAKIVHFSRSASLGDTDSAKRGMTIVFGTDQTCFYAEQGGQIWDKGVVRTDTGEIEVTKVVRRGKHILHSGYVTRGEIWPMQRCDMFVDPSHRVPTMKNHTATHLMNWALREVLCAPEERENPQVQQKGSLVDPEKTRFDFSHTKALSDEEIDRIERLVNERIEEKLPVYAKVIEQERARQINTLRAVFGEKYPDQVRVVSIGVPITEEEAKQAGESDWLLNSPKNPEWMKYSVEFCGGTHIQRTDEAEHFVLVSEEGVARGIRRVVGVSGEAAQRAEAAGRALLEEVADLESAADPAERERWSGDPGVAESGGSARAEARNSLPARVADVQRRLSEAVIPVRVRRQVQARLGALQDAAKQQQKQAAAVSGEAVMDRVSELFQAAEGVGGVKVVVGEVPEAPAEKLRGAIDWVRNKSEASAVLLAMVSDGKVTLIAGMSRAVVERGVKAGDLIREVAPLVGGKGGGRPDMAQGGGTEPGGVPAALDAARAWLRQHLM